MRIIISGFIVLFTSYLLRISPNSNKLYVTIPGQKRKMTLEQQEEQRKKSKLLPRVTLTLLAITTAQCTLVERNLSPRLRRAFNLTKLDSFS